MYCQSCGRELVKDAQFCPYCGLKIQEEKQKEEILIIEENKFITKWEKIGLVLSIVSFVLSFFVFSSVFLIISLVLAITTIVLMIVLARNNRSRFFTLDLIISTVALMSASSFLIYILILK